MCRNATLADASLWLGSDLRIQMSRDRRDRTRPQHLPEQKGAGQVRIERTIDGLAALLRQIDGAGYGSYKRIVGEWRGAGLSLAIDHVQGDPFATPSRLRLILPAAWHGIPHELCADSRPRRVAVADKLLRVFATAVAELPRSAGSGASGLIRVDAGGAEIIERSGCTLAPDRLELRFRTGLPAAGRRVLGRAAADLLCDHLPRAAEALRWTALDHAAVTAWADIAEDHALLQAALTDRGLVAFVADGSLLPRATGVSQRPMSDAIPFIAPASLRVTLPTRHHGDLVGMGLPAGVTLITGGGFHGKTTLLEAIQRGVYPHIPGDGREWVVTRPDAAKVRSEDGRAVTGVDLRPFIHDLPGRVGTSFFTTRDASGSTSLAAAILEAIEVGADVLLLDEDTCATNMLLRDARMQALVQRETITPFIDRVRALHDQLGVSTVLVAGGSGDYLDVADTVLLMDEYRPREVTAEARRVAAAHPTGRAASDSADLQIPARVPSAHSFDPRRGRRDRIRARGRRELVFGEDVIDLDALEQLVDDAQARAIGTMLRRLGALAGPGRPLLELLDRLYAEVERYGLVALEDAPDLALPRPLELAAAVNRLRALEVGERRDSAEC